MPTTQPLELPHHFLAAWLTDALGRRAAVLGASVDDSIRPFVIGLSDQLGVYYAMRPFAQLRVGAPTIRTGQHRSYVFLPLRDRSSPLRLQQTMQRWEPTADVNWLPAFIQDIVGTRWRFIWRHLSLLRDILVRLTDQVVTYYAQNASTREAARPVTIGLLRLMEDVDVTWICVEIDDRAGEGQRETVGRYRVQ